jgi:hypothetical protein
MVALLTGETGIIRSIWSEYTDPMEAELPPSALSFTKSGADRLTLP